MIYKRKSLACFSAFSLSHSLISHRLLCVCLCVCVRASVKTYVCFNLGCSDAELLSLHRSSPHTWHFWGCRWRLSTSISSYLTHPLCLNFCSLRFLFSSSSAPRISSCIFCQPVSFVVHPPPRFFVLFFYILLQDVERCSGIACFRQFSCQLTTILSVLPMPIFILYLALPLLCRDINTFSCVFCQTFFSPQWCLRRHLTSHYINLQGYSWEM